MHEIQCLHSNSFIRINCGFVIWSIWWSSLFHSSLSFLGYNESFDTFSKLCNSLTFEGINECFQFSQFFKLFGDSLVNDFKSLLVDLLNLLQIVIESLVLGIEFLLKSDIKVINKISKVVRKIYSCSGFLWECLEWLSFEGWICWSVSVINLLGGIVSSSRCFGKISNSLGLELIDDFSQFWELLNLFLKFLCNLFFSVSNLFLDWFKGL